jgi:peptidyl-tRNA hydrolase, PTH1 family
VKLIVGLGNPGSGYADTRHNVGFWVADELAERYRVRFRKSSAWRAQTAKISGELDVVLAEPLTFMNASGWAVRDIAEFYKVPIPDILVLVDDADLPLGKLRMRERGSAGGHNGLKSVIQELGSDEFPRLRIGVGRQAGELKNHVLGRFDEHERESIDLAVKRAADAAEMFVKEGIIKAMNRFNASETVQSEDSQA